MSLTEYKHTINGKSAKTYQFKTHSDNTKTAHFYAGNGFAVGVYQPLLATLASQFDIFSLAMRGCWYDKPNAKKLNRQQDADLLINYLEHTQNKPVVGIGHSMGATATAIAAAKRPDLFSALYLIEPVTFTHRQATIYNCLPKWIKSTQEPFKSTKTKQNNWQSIEAYYQHLRNHRAYKRISDEHLQKYAKGSLEPSQSGDYQLIFPAEQELANYYGKTPFIDNALIELNKIDLPYTIITGKPSIFTSHKVRKNWQKFLSKTQLITLPEYGHLLPLEAPNKCANIVLTHEFES